jgi:hypothetical protein
MFHVGGERTTGSIASLFHRDVEKTATKKLAKPEEPHQKFIPVMKVPIPRRPVHFTAI